MRPPPKAGQKEQSPRTQPSLGSEPPSRAQARPPSLDSPSPQPQEEPGQRDHSPSPPPAPRSPQPRSPQPSSDSRARSSPCGPWRCEGARNGAGVPGASGARGWRRGGAGCSARCSGARAGCSPRRRRARTASPCRLAPRSTAPCSPLPRGWGPAGDPAEPAGTPAPLFPSSPPPCSCGTGTSCGWRGAAERALSRWLAMPWLPSSPPAPVGGWRGPAVPWRLSWLLAALPRQQHGPHRARGGTGGGRRAAARPSPAAGLQLQLLAALSVPSPTARPPPWPEVLLHTHFPFFLFFCFFFVFHLVF